MQASLFADFQDAQRAIAAHKEALMCAQTHRSAFKSSTTRRRNDSDIGLALVNKEFCSAIVAEREHSATYASANQQRVRDQVLSAINRARDAYENSKAETLDLIDRLEYRVLELRAEADVLMSMGRRDHLIPVYRSLKSLRWYGAKNAHEACIYVSGLIQS